MNLIDNLWSLLPLPSLIIDADDQIAAINGAAETFLSTGQSQLKGRSL